MTQIAPYYFDNELISANLRRIGGDEDPTYVFEVNVNDDDLKIRVSNKLADYEDSVERWHVETEKETAAAEAAEGVEITRREREANGTDVDGNTT
jgi:TolB-like protein